MPPSIVRRAQQVLRQLETTDIEDADRDGKPAVSKADVKSIGGMREGCQLSFFQLDDPLLSQIHDKIMALDINNLTPVEALNTLNDLKSLITGK